MKALSLLMALMLSFSHVQGKNLSNPDSPSEYFQKNARARAEFVQYILASEDLSEEQKMAYVALVEPNNLHMTGDQVLELIDEETLRWFYTSRMDGVERIHDAAIVSRQPISRDQCRGYQLCVWVSKATQTLSAYYNGRAIQGLYNVPVSTARSGKITPTGTFTVEELAGPGRVSGRYNGAALYYAMQINGHIFIHATSRDNYPDLGRRASAGCIRTTFQVAEQLNHLMRQIGDRRNGFIRDSSNIRVVVTAQ
jgi:hypothetical protein